MENELNPETIKIIDERISPYLERIKILEGNQLEKEKEIIILKHAVNDILIKIDAKNVICLEPTWRTTGRELKGEIEKKQNSLTTSHIQQYVLNKVMEYVKDLGY